MNLDRATLAKLPKALRIEIAENTLRKNLTQSELAALQEHILEVLQRTKQQGRRTDLERKGGTSGKTFPEVEQRATGVVGKMFGESHKQVEKRLAVTRAAQAEPERFGKLRDDMDRRGRVDGPHRRLRNMRQAETIRAEPPPLPGNGPYRVIVADPPWAFDPLDPDPEADGRRPYPTMTLDTIKALPVAGLAGRDTILWLWTTSFHMRSAYDVLDAWDYRYAATLTWDKCQMGRGRWLREQTEHCLMAVRGKPTITLTSETTLIREPAREHSRKPEAFYQLVEKLCPAPRYAELFSRRLREGWDGHGNEIGVSDERPAP